MKGKRLLGILCVVVFFVVSLVGCGSKEPAKPAATSPPAPPTATSDANTLLFVGEENYKPISFEENGQIVGISPDVIREVFGRMGYKVKLELVPWKRCQEMTSNGEADAFFSAYKTDAREKLYIYPQEPILVEKNVFFVRKDSNITYAGDLAALEPYAIGTFTGYNTLDKYTEKGIITKVDRSTNSEEALNKLISGDRGVDLVLNNDFVLAYTANKMGKADAVKQLPTPYASENSYLTFTKKKDLSAVIAKFEVELKKMKTDGSYDKIVEKYVGKQK